MWHPSTPYECKPWRGYDVRRAGWFGWRLVALPVRVALTAATFTSAAVVAKVYCLFRGLAPAWWDRWFRWFAGFTSRFLLVHVFGFRLIVVDNGTTPVRDVIVANHVAVYDGFAIMATVGAVAFVARTSFSTFPVVGTVLEALDVVGIDRRNRQTARDRIKAALTDRRWPLACFPEGTTTNGVGLLDFKSGAFQGTHVHPIALTYTCPSGFDLSYTSNQMSASAVLHHFIRTLLEPDKIITVFILPPITRDPGDDDLAFATKARTALANAANLHLWDGWDNSRLRSVWFQNHKSRNID